MYSTRSWRAWKPRINYSINSITARTTVWNRSKIRFSLWITFPKTSGYPLGVGVTSPDHVSDPEVIKFHWLISHTSRSKLKSGAYKRIDHIWAGPEVSTAFHSLCFLVGAKASPQCLTVRSDASFATLILTGNLSINRLLVAAGSPGCSRDVHGQWSEFEKKNRVYHDMLACTTASLRSRFLIETSTDLYFLYQGADCLWRMKKSNRQLRMDTAYYDVHRKINGKICSHLPWFYSLLSIVTQQLVEFYAGLLVVVLWSSIQYHLCALYSYGIVEHFLSLGQFWRPFLAARDCYFQYPRLST